MTVSIFCRRRAEGTVFGAEVAGARRTLLRGCASVQVEGSRRFQNLFVLFRVRRVSGSADGFDQCHEIVP